MTSGKIFTKKRYVITNFNKTVNVDDNEYFLKSGQAKICYNLRNCKGAIIQGKGFEELSLPYTKILNSAERHLTFNDNYTIKKVWRYKFLSSQNQDYEYALIFYASNKKLYYINMFGGSSTITTLGNNIVFNEEPSALMFRIGDKDVIGFSSPSDPLLIVYCDDAPYQVLNIPKFKSLCLHNKRLFAIDSEKNYLVRYSSNLNPLDWTNNVTTTSGGTIELNDYKGMLNKLISFKDSVFVFGDFGISKISAYLSNSAFTVSNIYNSSNKIYCNTACICGNNIYFLTEDGLYKLDGFNVEKVKTNLDYLFVNTSQEGSNTCFYNGNLYIACSLNFADGESVCEENNESHKNNALIEFNIESGQYDIIRGVDVSCLLAVKDLNVSKLIACMNNSLGQKVWQLSDVSKLGNNSLNKKWESGKIYFEAFDKLKILKEVNLICKYNTSLKVVVDNKVNVFNILGKEDVQRVRINLAGKIFSFSFESTLNNFYISSPQFIFNVEN